MYIRVANGEPYDILVPSDYMIERLLQEDLLQPLDKSKLNCMDLLVEGVKGLPYDPNNDYSVPYFWGTVGIVYDKTKVSEEDLQREGFNIFLDTKYKGDIYLYDSVENKIYYSGGSSKPDFMDDNEILTYSMTGNGFLVFRSDNIEFTGSTNCNYVKFVSTSTTTGYLYNPSREYSTKLSTNSRIHHDIVILQPLSQGAVVTITAEI